MDDDLSLGAMRWGPAEAPATQLVVLLHGLGADGADLIDLAPYWSRALPHAAFVAPHAPEPYVEAGFGRQWFSRSASPDLREAAADASRAWLDRFIDDELARLGLADYALMGFSQGAMMALHTGLGRQVAPRAILAFSGALLGGAPLVPERLSDSVSRPPILLVHGDADDVVPVQRSRDAAIALRGAGLDVQELYRPGLGHGIDDAGLSAGALMLQRGFATRAVS